MGLSEKTTSRVNKEPQIDLSLSKQEYEKLFEVLKDSNVKGGDVQIMYNIILKLQTQYIEKYNKK